MPKQVESYVLPHTDNRCRVFKRTQEESLKGSYYIKIRLNSGKYSVKSTKTNDLHKAMGMAKTMWMEMELSEARGINWTSSEKRTLHNFYPDFIASLHCSKKRKYLIENTFERLLLPFFGNKKMSSIRQSDWIDYQDWRLTFHERLDPIDKKRLGVKSEISRDTLKGELQALLQMCRWMAANNITDTIPVIKVQAGVGRTDRQRSKTISKKEWSKIRDKMKKWAHYPFIGASKELNKDWEEVEVSEAQRWMTSIGNNKGRGTAIKVDGLKRPLSIAPSHYFSRLRTFYFIMTAYHSGIRPSTSELASLRWRNLTIEQVDIKGQKVWVVFVRISKSKKGKAKGRYLTQHGSYHLLKWLKLSKKWEKGGMDDYVFPRLNSDKLLTGAEIGDMFHKFLIGEGLKKDREGRSITMYSYARHQAIDAMLRNWDINRVLLASDASLSTISTSYAESLIRKEPVSFATREKDPKPIQRAGGAYKSLQSEIETLKSNG
jgi:hypothetical protein